jgi:crotonobetainyl-CoA:carnitine CoA-transferase CaiB-like acyl-CoA transferase
VHIDAVLGMLAREFVTRTSAEWMALLEAADLPVTPVHTLDSIFADPHLVATGFFEPEEHPTEGRVTRMAVPVKFSATPTGERSPSPKLGGDSAAILAEAGYGEAEIAALVAARAVFATP